MTPVSSFGMEHHHGSSVSPMSGSPGSCLQQRDTSGYCMSRPTYEPLTLSGSYSTRPSCSPTQPYQSMNGVGQYTTNGGTSTGEFSVFGRGCFQLGGFRFQVWYRPVFLYLLLCRDRLQICQRNTGRGFSDSGGIRSLRCSQFEVFHYRCGSISVY